jgi:hypothetical protein
MTIDRDGEGPPLRRDDARAAKGSDDLRASAFTEDVFDDEYYGRRRRSSGVSFGVIAGVVFVAASAAVTGWYFLASRSMSTAGPDGSSQIVKADPTPYKIKPEDPGGLQVDNQDKLIYDRVAKSAAPSRVENLLPAPEEPHAPPTKAPAPTPAPPAPAPSASTPDATSAPSTSDALATLMTQVEGSHTASTPPPEAAPMPVTAAAKTAETEAPAPAPAAAEPKAPPAKTGSPMLLVPAEEAPAKAAEAPSPAAVVAAADVPPAGSAAAPAAAGTGTVMIQLASAQTEEAAMGEWKRINGKNADLLTGLSPTVIAADIPNVGTRYRLRAGPVADKATADALCLSLAVRNVKCFVARP